MINKDDIALAGVYGSKIDVPLVSDRKTLLKLLVDQNTDILAVGEKGGVACLKEGLNWNDGLGTMIADTGKVLANGINSVRALHKHYINPVIDILTDLIYTNSGNKDTLSFIYDVSEIKFITLHMGLFSNFVYPSELSKRYNNGLLSCNNYVNSRLKFTNLTKESIIEYLTTADEEINHIVAKHAERVAGILNNASNNGSVNIGALVYSNRPEANEFSITSSPIIDMGIGFTMWLLYSKLITEEQPVGWITGVGLDEYNETLRLFKDIFNDLLFFSKEYYTRISKNVVTFRLSRREICNKTDAVIFSGTAIVNQEYYDSDNDYSLSDAIIGWMSRQTSEQFNIAMVTEYLKDFDKYVEYINGRLNNHSDNLRDLIADRLRLVMFSTGQFYSRLKRLKEHKGEEYSARDYSRHIADIIMGSLTYKEGEPKDKLVCELTNCVAWREITNDLEFDLCVKVLDSAKLAVQLGTEEKDIFKAATVFTLVDLLIDKEV